MRNRVLMVLLTGFAVLAAAPPTQLLAAPSPVGVIIGQPNSPIEITQYKAIYQRRSNYTTEGIAHDLQYRNRGNQKVVAIRFGLVSFSVFNQFLGKTGGVSMEELIPGQAEKGSWVAMHYAGFSFLTGLSYVDLVRLEDGTIWQADEAAILDEIRKIEKDFDAKLLREKERGQP